MIILLWRQGSKKPIIHPSAGKWPQTVKQANSWGRFRPLTDLPKGSVSGGGRGSGMRGGGWKVEGKRWFPPVSKSLSLSPRLGGLVRIIRKLSNEVSSHYEPPGKTPKPALLFISSVFLATSCGALNGYFSPMFSFGLPNGGEALMSF